MITRALNDNELFTFSEVIDMLSDGLARVFTTEHMSGYFYKAPFPDDPDQTLLDGACSAITYWRKSDHTPMSPTMLLDEFQDDEPQWTCVLATHHPSTMQEKKS